MTTPSFQSTPRAGGDHALVLVAPRSLHFNPRPRAGGNLSPSSASLAWTNFNPRPAQGATIVLSIAPTSAQNFNPRPRAGATFIIVVCIIEHHISIHAPAQGVDHLDERLEDGKISIHIINASAGFQNLGQSRSSVDGSQAADGAFYRLSPHLNAISCRHSALFRKWKSYSESYRFPAG